MFKRMFMTAIAATSFAVICGGAAVAADAYQAGADAARIKEQGEEIGRAAAREGERIADEAADAAKQIADDFKAGYNDAKNRPD